MFQDVSCKNNITVGITSFLGFAGCFIPTAVRGFQDSSSWRFALGESPFPKKNPVSESCPKETNGHGKQVCGPEKIPMLGGDGIFLAVFRECFVSPTNLVNSTPKHQTPNQFTRHHLAMTGCPNLLEGNLNTLGTKVLLDPQVIR